jgi:hypothetical protein
LHWSAASTPQALAVSVTVGTSPVAESGALEFTFTLDQPAVAPLSVKFSFGAGQGASTECADYGTVTFAPNNAGSSFDCTTSPGGGVVRFVAGDAAVTISVPFASDTIPEGVEELVVTVDADTAYTPGNPSTVSGFVTDKAVGASWLC